MRYFLGGVFFVAVLFVAAFGYSMYIGPQGEAAFTPIEVGSDGFAKKTLQSAEIKAIYDTETALTINGNENSALKVVVFYDYNCPYCMIEEAALDEALSGRDDVWVILRPVPFLGDGSFEMAKLAMAAARLGIFPEFHKVIFNALGKMTLDRALTLLEEANIPTQDLAQLSTDSLIRAAVEENHRLAVEIGAHYVPAFVIGKRLYMPLDRDTTPEDFQDMFDQEILNAR
jgi:protein-disulfide isomerase